MSRPAPARSARIPSRLVAHRPPPDDRALRPSPGTRRRVLPPHVFVIGALVLIAAVVIPAATSRAQLPFRRGDVDGDGCVEPLADTVYVMESLFVPGAPGIDCMDAADANGTGTVDIGDAAFLLAWGFFAGSPPPPPPGPIDCGPAPPGMPSLGCDAYDCTPAPCPAALPTPDLQLSMVDATAQPGEVVPVPVILDHSAPGVALDGWSLGVCIDGAQLDVIGVDLGATTLVVNGGAPPDFSEIQILGGAGWTAGCLISFGGLATLGVGGGYELYVASVVAIDVPPGGSELAFCEVLGDPPVPLVFVAGVESFAPESPQSGWVFPATTGQPFRRGDADGDGCVAALVDGVHIVRWLFTLPPPSIGCLDAADANEDGAVNISDALLLLAWGFIPGSPPPAPPGPDDCGLPAGPSPLGCDVYDCAPVSCPAPPVDPGLQLHMPEVAGVLGSSVDLPVLLDHDLPGIGLDGWSLGVCHDATEVEILDVALGATTQVVNGGAPPDFSQVTLYGGSGWTAGCVISYLGGATLQFGTGYELYVATYDLLSAVPAPGSEVTFCDTLGVPPVPIAFTTAGLSLGADSSDSGWIEAAAAPGTFIRGDVNGDSNVDEADYAQLAAYLFGAPLFFGGPPDPVGCGGDVVLDAGDINDNESFSVADLLLFRDHLDCGAALPAPAECAPDPGEDDGGFGMPDLVYIVQATTVSVTGAPTEVRAVDVLVRVRSPEPVKAVQVALEYGAALTPGAPTFTVDAGLTADFAGTAPGPGQLVLTVGREGCGEILMPATGGGFATLGVLHFELAPFGVFPPIQWLQETVIDGLTYRATIVDDLYQDHQPFLVAGSFEFVRGNANNGDALVDIADAIFTLSYLFQQGPTPDCEDAADCNNDGTIDIADPIYELSFLFGDGPPLVPYPMCFWEFDIDLLTCEAPLCP